MSDDGVADCTPAEVTVRVETCMSTEELLDVVEDMARQHIYTDDAGRTDSMALSANAAALRTLAAAGRFRITREVRRLVLGYWPEHDPERRPA